MLELLCPCCEQGRLEVFFEFENVPTNSCILLESQAEAVSWPKGNIRLAYCDNCGFVSNVAFDQKLTEYSARYEETQAYSPTFNRFHESLVDQLIDRHDLRGKEIIEIGCGKGEFLDLLCRRGGNAGLGFDPGYSESRGAGFDKTRMKVVVDFFDERYSDEQADLVACKMTLEHIHRPLAFARLAAAVVKRPDGVVFIQVPESGRILQECAFEDIYYEHCSYFTGDSLGVLFDRLSFDVIHSEVTYGGQYLTVEARPRTGSGVSSNSVRSAADGSPSAALVESFGDRLGVRLNAWAERLQHWADAAKDVVLWGSGSKGVAFLASVPGADRISRAVDINPYRQGYFMPGSGVPIVSPESLASAPPDAVVVMNRVYEDEIRRRLNELGMSPEVVSL